MTRTKQALELYESKQYNCAQSVFLPFAKEFGIDRETALKLTSSLGGGLAVESHVCGAVLGAHLILGLKYGYLTKDDINAPSLREKTRSFLNRFSGLFGSVNCGELKATNRSCGLFVEGAAKLLVHEFDFSDTVK